MDIASNPQNLDHSALWARIQNHCFVPGFAGRLAREHRWRADFAAAAIEEYRRFCFLAAVSVRPVTPSEEVDEVWHLHLIHTRDYWDVWCGQVLGARLHHDASEGGPAALAKHVTQYAGTLALYEQHFGPPPARLWPASASRFARTTRYQGLDTTHWFSVPRLAWFLSHWRFK
jgi:hypothetical protein